MALDEVVEGPADGVERVVQLASSSVAVLELRQSPGQGGHRARQGEPKLDVVASWQNNRR